MRRGELPEQLVSAKKSKYRRKIASLAKPLDSIRVNSLDLAKKMRDYFIESNSKLDDPQNKKHALEKFINFAVIKRYGVTDPSIDDDADEIYWELFYNDGVFYDSANRSYFLGPLQRIEESCGIEIFVAALEPSEQRISLYVKKRDFEEDGISFPPRIILNSFSILEDSVRRISLFRYNELESLFPLLIRPDERSGVKKSLVKARLNKLLPREKLQKKDYEKLIKNLTDPKYKTGINKTLLQLFTARCCGLVVRESYANDDVEHTLKLCNLNARSSVIQSLMFYHECDRRMANEGIIPSDNLAMEDFQNRNLPNMDNISCLAEMAYGNPILRLGDILISTILSWNSMIDSVKFFHTVTMPKLMKEIGAAPTIQENYNPQALIDRHFKILSTPPKRFRTAAAKILDNIYIKLTGKTLFETFPDLEEKFRKIQETDFIRAEDLPEIAEQWRKEHVIE